MFCFISVVLVALLSSTSAVAAPFNDERHAATGPDHDVFTLESHEENELDAVLNQRMRENQRKRGNVHSHIVAVNDVYENARRQFPLKADSQTQENEAIDEEIVSSNKGDRGLFEGDLVLDPGDLDVINHKRHETDLRKRNVITNRKKLWPNAVVRCFIDNKLDNIKPLIMRAMDMFEQKTCIKFELVSPSDGGDYVHMFPGPGCYSRMGRVGGNQPLSLGKGCGYVGVVMHEMMHALGIWHEQSRPDRDRYVQIIWDNIQPGREKNFRKYDHGKVDTLGLEYDYKSLMHYDRYLYSVGGRLPTIIARGRPWRRLGGQLRGTFTASDIKEINALYNC